jgi:branched-chain amino acid transport system permease protein
MGRARGLVRNYAQDVRLVRSPKGVLVILALIAVYLLAPFVVDDTWANVLVVAGFTAIGALGLNLLTGYTGLPSLGTAGFVAIGAFTASYLGRSTDLAFADPPGRDWPFWQYTLVAVAVGALVGFIVGLPALRLRGVYLSIATLAIVFVTLFVLNQWVDVSGGNAGTSMPIDELSSLPTAEFLGVDWLQIGGEDATFLGEVFGPNQGLIWLVWAFVAVAWLLCRNIVRSRPGRALQAVRDRDVAAAVVGVSLFRTKVGAFVISSALASLAGVFFGLWQQYIQADDSFFGLNLSIEFLAIIVVGGIGTSYGPVIGALLIASIEPKVVPLIADLLPFLFSDDPNSAGFSEGNFAALVYALLIVVGLVTAPFGLAGIARQIGGYFRSWPLAR